jgi:uncharacterized membrane protein YidH (DUF202 family)
MNDHELGILVLVIGLLVLSGLGWKWYPKTGEEVRNRQFLSTTINKNFFLVLGLIFTIVVIFLLLVVFQRD